MTICVLIRASRALLCVTLAAATVFAGVAASADPPDAGRVVVPIASKTIAPFVESAPGAIGPKSSVLSGVGVFSTERGAVIKGDFTSKCPVHSPQTLVVFQNGRRLGTIVIASAAADQTIPFSIPLATAPAGPLTFAIERNGKRTLSSSPSLLPLGTRLHPVGGTGTPGPTPTPTYGPVHTEIVILQPCD